MARTTWLVILVITATFILLAAAQKESAPAKPPTHPTASDDDVRAMKADVQRMRALITQMQNNLGFVAGTTNPLRHQFELEIEMWQVSVSDMERRIARAEAAQHQ